MSMTPDVDESLAGTIAAIDGKVETLRSGIIAAKNEIERLRRLRATLNDALPPGARPAPPAMLAGTRDPSRLPSTTVVDLDAFARSLESSLEDAAE